MSKLYDQYIKLKKENPSEIYLFKSGVFYIALAEDANQLANLFQFKLVNFNDTILKCGFPLKRLAYYSDLLNANHIPFQIVDSDYGKIDNYNDYLHNETLKHLIQSILEIDMNNTTFQESFHFLQELQTKLKGLYE